MLQIEISMGKQGIYCYPTFYQNFNSHFNEVSPLSPSYSIDSFTYNTQASWLVRSVQLLNQLRKQEEEIRLPWSFFPEWRLVRTWSRTWKKNRGLSSKASIIRDVDGHYFNVHGPQLLGLVSHVPITKGPVQRTLGCSGILKTTRSKPYLFLSIHDKQRTNKIESWQLALRKHYFRPKTSCKIVGRIWLPCALTTHTPSDWLERWDPKIYTLSGWVLFVYRGKRRRTHG